MAFSIFSDEELDQLLLTASQQYEDEEEKEERLRVKYQDMKEDDFTHDNLLAGLPQQHEEVQQTESQACNKENSRFAPPVTEAEIIEKIH